MSIVPQQFQVRGTRPDAVKSRCNVCQLLYTDHSGTRCAICKEAVEHHTAEGFAECLAGQRRMAGARSRAGIELNDLDREALRDA